MPEVAFIVKLNLLDDSNASVIENEAEDIADSLLSDGFDVVSVEPYARPSIGLPAQPEREGNPPLSFGP